jgi:ribosomal protein S12 methylthiotransferase accessory factor
MEIRVTFAGERRVDASFEGHVVKTDQSVEHDGRGEAPEPFELFLASIATCAGAYVLAYCRARGIPTEGIELVQRERVDEVSHRVVCVDLELTLPSTFPEKYRAAIVKAAEGCKVKKALASPPDVGVTLRVADDVVSAA